MDFKTQIKSTVTTGTAPLSITSTTKVANLNVDKLDDQEGSYYTNVDNHTSGTTNKVYTATEQTKLAGIAANANNYTLPAATSSALGGIELFSDTQQSVAANAVSTTASRTYGLQVNSSGQGVINVPWTDTVYTHPTYTYNAPTAGAETILTDITLLESLTQTNGHVTGGSYRKLVAGSNITITPAADGNITIASSAGGGTTTNALTMNNSGTGAASGTTFDGSAAVTLSYNTIGAAASSHTHNYAGSASAGGPADSTKATLTFTGGSTATFNGSTAASVAIPTTLPASDVYAWAKAQSLYYGSYGNADLNNSFYIANNWIGSASITTNAPNNVAGYYYIINIRHGGGANDGNIYGTQILVGMTVQQNRVFSRLHSAGTWTAWNELSSPYVFVQAGTPTATHVGDIWFIP